jgi:hypothetical protein
MRGKEWDVNARFDNQNNALRNPVLRITPLPTFDPTLGIVHPRLFPRHAKELYALQRPSDQMAPRDVVVSRRLL